MLKAKIMISVLAAALIAVLILTPGCREDNQPQATPAEQSPDEQDNIDRNELYEFNTTDEDENEQDEEYVEYGWGLSYSQPEEPDRSIDKAFQAAISLAGLDDAIIHKIDEDNYLIAMPLVSDDPAREAVLKAASSMAVAGEFLDQGRIFFAGIRQRNISVVLTADLADIKKAHQDQDSWIDFMQQKLRVVRKLRYQSNWRDVLNNFNEELNL